MTHYLAVATGHPTLDGVAYNKPAAIRKIVIAASGAARVAIHDGVDALAPLLYSREFFGRNTGGQRQRREGDLPFRTAMWVVITGAATDVHLYGA